MVIGSKTAPKRRKDQEKGDTEDTFTGLSEIAQDFYGARATDMFHGITDIYVESDEEDNILEPEVNDKTSGSERIFKLNQGDDCGTKSLLPAGRPPTKISQHNKVCLDNRGGQGSL